MKTITDEIAELLRGCEAAKTLIDALMSDRAILRITDSAIAITTTLFTALFDDGDQIDARRSDNGTIGMVAERNGVRFVAIFTDNEAERLFPAIYAKC